jgi:hypothetical protein
MRENGKTWMALVVAGGAIVIAAGAYTQGRVELVSRPLKSITLNTGAYGVAKGQIDRRSVSISAQEDMHIVAIEHFVGVGLGTHSDNGHMLSLSSENAWTKWESGGTGMEPTGASGYFGYCGRDYYGEIGGIQDVMAYESLPAGTHILVPRGQTLYMHCYAHNFTTEPTGYFHHAVRVLYWQ